MREIIIWGAGRDYQSLYNLIKFEELKGNIEVIAIADKHAWQITIDGYKVIRPGEIKNHTFDYIVISSSKYYEEIKAEALKLGIKRESLIRGAVLQIPCFDFAEYAQLRENPVSIISDDCWGGFLYHYLDLPFMTPFINLRILDSGFLKMIGNLEKYLSRPLIMERQGDMRFCPVGSLDVDGEKVFLFFVHHDTFEEARKDFDRRRGRINGSNLFIKMSYDKAEFFQFSTSEDDLSDKCFCKYMSWFDSLPYKKKICWVHSDMGTQISLPSVVVRNSFTHEYPEWSRGNPRLCRGYDFDMNYLEKEYDIFKLLLTGEHNARFD